MKTFKRLSAIGAVLSLVAGGAAYAVSATATHADDDVSAQAAVRHMEDLDRGVVAVRAETDSVFASWRLLGPDPDGTLRYSLAHRNDVTVKGHMQSHHADYCLGEGVTEPDTPAITH